jgi:transposase
MRTYRGIAYRLLPGTKVRARQLASLAGATRYVWNHFLARNREAHELHKEGKGEKPIVSFCSLGKEFTKLRENTEWLQELSYTVVRYALKHQADAFKEFLKGNCSHPRFKA